MVRFHAIAALVLALAAAAARGQAPDAASPQLVTDRELFDFSTPEASRYWAEVDYLLWWVKPVCEPPATVTVGLPTDPRPGVTGQPGTTIAMGNTRFEFHAASGVRPSIGMWLDDEHTWGAFASGIILPRVSNTRTFTAGSNGAHAYLSYTSPTGRNEAIPFAIPGVVNGFSSEEGRTQLWGAEVNALAQARLATDSTWQGRVGVLLGARYQFLEDEVLLRNTQTLVANPALVSVGQNHFVTNNQFVGPQFGLMLAASCDCCEFQFTQKLATGVTFMKNSVSGGPLVSGSQLVSGSLPGPLLAMPSNNGHLKTIRATVLPEVNAKLRFRVTDALKLSLGYNFLYWNRIFCPGDLMDKQVNLTQLPAFGPETGPRAPVQQFARTDYFAQGLELGLMLDY